MLENQMQCLNGNTLKQANIQKINSVICGESVCSGMRKVSKHSQEKAENTDMEQEGE